MVPGELPRPTSVSFFRDLHLHLIENGVAEVPDLGFSLFPESFQFELAVVRQVEVDLEPELGLALESEGELAADNVTTADFGYKAPRTVPVVSVVMDRKRPNMVRVVGKHTRLSG